MASIFATNAQAVEQQYIENRLLSQNAQAVEEPETYSAVEEVVEETVEEDAMNVEDEEENDERLADTFEIDDDERES